MDGPTGLRPSNVRPLCKIPQRLGLLTRCDVGQLISIDTLPDDILLAIFVFCSYRGQSLKERIEAWQSLVHVCRRWRSIVFGSPGHLDLQLVCTTRTRARDTLDVWPALPLNILCEDEYPAGSVDNIIAVLERSDRVRVIYLTNIRNSDLETILPVMHQPFPKLTHLRLASNDEVVPVVPDSFLGGSAPHLEYFMSSRILFQDLPNLLLSATHFVTLRLESIPHSGYISPMAMVTVLSKLTSLETLSLEFQSPRSCPSRESQRPHPSTRSVLPVLTSFWFKGTLEYLEDFVARIDTPRLDALDIIFFNDIVFDTPRFIQFVSRTPMSRTLEKARITLQDGAAGVSFSSQASRYGEIDVEVLCRGLDWQVSSLEQVCTSCLPPLSMLEDLYIYKRPHSRLDWKENIGNDLWLELFRPFIAVKNLYLSEEFAPHIAPALQELVAARTTEVLRSLQNMFLEGFESSGSVAESIGQFVTARQIAGHPIAISRWINSELDKV